MFSIFIRNLLFTILQPGLVAGVFPYLILGNRFHENFNERFVFSGYAALMIFFTGFAVMTHCIIRFAIDGKGTLSPADPTKQLVVKGLYRYSRNPMYVGVLLMLAGESLFFSSLPLLLYALLVFCCFHVFIVRVEEPRLRKDFKETYTAYADKVKRWL